MEHEVDDDWHDLVARLEATPRLATSNLWALAGLVAGAAGLAPLVQPRALPVAAACGAVAVVCGLLGRRAVRRRQAPGLRLANAALLLAAVPLVTCAVVGVVAAVLLTG